jgi:serine/threonine-protein kinase
LVPGYREVRQLGTGSAGRVVLATYASTGAYVAIRFLRPLLWADPSFLARFREEARHLVDLDSPHVVRLHEYVETPTSAALVMELVDGVSLRTILTERGATTTEAALSLLKGSLLGLAAAHDLGLAHRSCKPANLLVQADGASKIADFGLALPAGPPPYPLPPAPPHDAPHAPTGPDLAALPEPGPHGESGLVAGGQAADLYAATCVFVECLTGSPPQDDVLRKVPKSVRALVASGLAADPGIRPATARDFAAAVESAARAAYGPEWDKRGRRHLADLATPLALRFPLAGPAPGSRATRPAAPRSGGRTAGPRTSGGGLPLGRAGGRRRMPRIRRPHLVRPRLAIVAALAAVAATTIVLTSDRGPADTFLTTPPSEPGTARTTGPAAAPDEPAEPAKPTTAPTTGPTIPVGAEITQPPDATTTRRPTAPPHRVSALRIAAFDGGRGTITVRASTGGAVTVTARFAEGTSRDRLTDAAPQRFTLSGAGAYSPVVSAAFAPPPCGVTVYRRLTVTTVPGGGTASRTAAVRGPACAAPAVREVRVLAWNGSAGTVRVTAEGPGPVRLSLSFTRRDGTGPARTLNTDTRDLRGRTEYTVKVGHPPGKVACGQRAHLGILVSTDRAAATGPQVSEAALDGPTCPQATTTPTASPPTQDPPDQESAETPTTAPGTPEENGWAPADPIRRSPA